MGDTRFDVVGLGNAIVDIIAPVQDAFLERFNIRKNGMTLIDEGLIVVDEDINPRDLPEVMWAVCTRSDPAQDIEILRRCLSGPLDPMISPEQRKRRDYGMSRAIIDATRPYEWRNEFPVVAESTPAQKAQMLAKWQSKL